MLMLRNECVACVVTAGEQQVGLVPVEPPPLMLWRTPASQAVCSTVPAVEQVGEAPAVGANIEGESGPHVLSRLAVCWRHPCALVCACRDCS